MIRRGWTTALGSAYLATALVCAHGCERKERIVDIETPRTEIEVDRDKSTGKVDVDITRE
ncbi:MAG: hypothetical protein GXY58_15990 [Planctomycetaceae bacterium]|nr:hypothetical protein [Planctomycetaceae bacterium]